MVVIYFVLIEITYDMIDLKSHEMLICLLFFHFQEFYQCMGTKVLARGEEYAMRQEKTTSI
jgi:hypothetical protein